MNYTRIIWAAALVLVVAVLLLVPGPWVHAVRQAGLSMISPVVNLVDGTGQWSRQFQKGLATLDTLQNEATTLREQNAKLATENTVLRDMAAENARLRELLGFKKASQYTLLAARLIARDPSNWWSTVLINRGYVDSETLRSDLPVVTARGVVGKTGVVSRDVTEVILMINQNCKVSGMVENSREQGILVGDGNADSGRPRTRLTYVSRNAQVGVGERVLTSGLGGVFPPGLSLGTITEVPPLSPKINFGLYREVYVEPAVDLSQLDEMFVVLGAPGFETLKVPTAPPKK